MAEAIARAYRWQGQMESGEYTDIQDLAKALSVDRKYVSRMLQLTSLAPDVVQAILAGEEPNGVSLTKLREGVPEIWEEQRKICPLKS